MITRFERYGWLLFYTTWFDQSYIIHAFPTENSKDIITNLEDWDQSKSHITVSRFQISCGVILPVIAVLACGYITLKRWKRNKETKRRIKLAMRNYSSNEIGEPENENDTIEPPRYTRRSSQPVLLAPIVKKIDDVIYNRLSSGIRRPSKAYFSRSVHTT